MKGSGGSREQNQQEEEDVIGYLSAAMVRLYHLEQEMESLQAIGALGTTG